MPKGRLKHMRPRLRDLFGEIPVYTYEVEAWLLAVPKMHPNSPRAPWYVLHWDVAGKIRAFKATRQPLPEPQAPGRGPGAWPDRFSWVYR
jgi:hypothetical protein